MMHVTARQDIPHVSMSNFNFDVQFKVGGNGLVGAFFDVSGLDTQAYGSVSCDFDIPLFSLITIPEVFQNTNVTLSNGVFDKGIMFDDWFNNSIKKSVNRNTVIVTLLDDVGKPAIIWTLKDAWPIKIVSEEPCAGSRKIVIKSIELTHRGITIEVA